MSVGAGVGVAGVGVGVAGVGVGVAGVGVGVRVGVGVGVGVVVAFGVDVGVGDGGRVGGPSSVGVVHRSWRGCRRRRRCYSGLKGLSRRNSRWATSEIILSVKICLSGGDASWPFLGSGMFAGTKTIPSFA